MAACQRLHADFSHTPLSARPASSAALRPPHPAGENAGVHLDVNACDDPLALAVLLHPHPDFGGNRFHPFVDALHHRLPDVRVAALRFDFSSSDPANAHREAVDAIDAATERWPQRPLVLVGYSFGAGVAVGVDDDRIAAWYLLAPPTAELERATIGRESRPKAIVVPEHDQFFPPATVERIVATWVSTTLTVAEGADHFLGAVDPVATGAVEWIRRVAET